MVTFYEFDNSPTEQYSEDGGFVAKRRLQCAWVDRYDLLNYIGRGAGMEYPYGSIGAWAVGATIIPFNDSPLPEAGDSTMMSYGTAIVTVTYAYSPSSPQFAAGIFMIEEMHPAIEYRTLNKDKMYAAASSGNVLTKDVHVLLPSYDYTVTSFGHVTLPVAALNLMGYVNNATWQTTFLGVAFNEERMLYMGPSPKVETRLGSKPALCITQTWKVRATPWTQDYTENGWEYIYNNAGNKLYPSANFDVLRPWAFI